jgi:hypothetical protein
MALGKLADLPRIERGLGGEVEDVEVRAVGKWRFFPVMSIRPSSLRAIWRVKRALKLPGGIRSALTGCGKSRSVVLPAQFVALFTFVTH